MPEFRIRIILHQRHPHRRQLVTTTGTQQVGHVKTITYLCSRPKHFAAIRKNAAKRRSLPGLGEWAMDSLVAAATPRFALGGT